MLLPGGDRVGDTRVDVVAAEAEMERARELRRGLQSIDAPSSSRKRKISGASPFRTIISSRPTLDPTRPARCAAARR